MFRGPAPTRPRPLWSLLTGLAACGLLLTACGGDQGREGPRADGSTEAEALDSYSLEPLAEPPPESGIKDVMDPELMSQALGDLPPGTEPVVNHYEDGHRQAQGFLCDGKPVGDWVYWHPGGHIAMRGSYVYGGLQHGRWVHWDTDGTRLSYGSYEHGKEEGEWWYWHDNGAPQMHGHYHDGIKIDRWSHFHRNGLRSAEGAFAAGRRTGTWRYWDRNGKLVNISTFHVELEPVPGDELAPLP